MYGTDNIRILKYSNTPLIRPGMNMWPYRRGDLS